jgi:hypothetical protein
VVDRSRARHVLTLPQAGLPTWVRSVSSTSCIHPVSGSHQQNRTRLTSCSPVARVGDGSHATWHGFHRGSE